MGSGTVSHSSFRAYASINGRSYDSSTGRVTGQEFVARKLDSSLNPLNFKVRECVNSEEHPNTIPVILALDVTGSMGESCKETAAALGTITTNLYEKFKDVEFCIMGIGDLECDGAPVQMSQFESDIRIAEALDKIYMEYGGGGNSYESYSVAWYMGLKRTKLDCFDKQGRKGIIITMGDEPLNPNLCYRNLNAFTNSTEEKNINTEELYKEASKKFDIFHIAVDSDSNCYGHYSNRITKSFGKILGSRLKVSSINNLAQTIENCIAEAIQGLTFDSVSTNNEGISW